MINTSDWPNVSKEVDRMGVGHLEIGDAIMTVMKDVGYEPMPLHTDTIGSTTDKFEQWLKERNEKEPEETT